MVVKINGWPISTRFHQIDAVHSTPHQGVDFAVPQGTQIPSISDGVVTKVTDEGTKSFGKAVWVHTSDGKDVVYGHLSQPRVTVGQHIHTGDVIGLSGNTGHSTGPHLHLQVTEGGKAVDPMHYIGTPSANNPPWWDLKGQAINAAQGVESWMGSEIHRLFMQFLHSLSDLLGNLLPTLATIGVIWWMCPFFPKSDKAPKLIGTSLIAYMFYVLIRGAY